MFEQGSDEIAFEAVGAGEGRDIFILQMGQTSACADPKRAVAVREEGADEVIGQAIGGGVGCDFAGLDVVQAVGGARPQAAVSAGSQREDDFAEKAVVCGEMLDLAGLQAIEAVSVGSYPHAVIGGLRDGGDDVIAEGGKRAEVLLSKDVEAGGLRADPEISFFVFEEGEHGAGADGWLKLRVAVAFAEGKEAFVGADPKISARVCQEGFNSGGGQVMAGLQGALVAIIQQRDAAAGSEPETVVWKSANAQNGFLRHIQAHRGGTTATSIVLKDARDRREQDTAVTG